MVDELIQPAALLPEIVSIRTETTSRSSAARGLPRQLVITTSKPVRGGAAGVLKGNGDDEGNKGIGGDTVPSSSSMLYAAFVDLQLVSQQREEGSGNTGEDPLDYSSSDSEPTPPPTMIIEHVQLSPLEERDNDRSTFVCASPPFPSSSHGERRADPRPHTVILLDVRPPLMETVSRTLQAMCNDAWEEMLATTTVYGSGGEEEGEASGGGNGGGGGGVPRPVFFASLDEEEDRRPPGSIRPLSQLSRIACSFGPNNGDDSNGVVDDTNGDGGGSSTTTATTDESPPSWTQWMKVPRIDKKEEKLERDAMTFEEVAAALTDVHGSLGVGGGSIPCCGDGIKRKKRNTVYPAPEKEKIELFDAALARFDDELMRAVVLARERCPDQVSDEEKSLFLRGQSTDDPEKAALKFCQHWKMRLELFGTDKAFLPLTIQGAMRDESEILSSATDIPGWYLPVVEDRFGRAIVYTTGSRECRTDENRLSKLRVLWYMNNMCLRNMTDVRKGMVVLVDLTNSRLQDADIGFIRQCIRMIDVFPMEVRAFHHMRFPWFDSFIQPVVNHLKGKKLRTRTVYHSGSESEVLDRLARYGLEASRLPKALGGDIVLDPNWIQQGGSFVEEKNTDERV